MYGYLRSATAKHNPSGIGNLRGRFRWVKLTPCTSGILPDQKKLLQSCFLLEQDRFLLLSAVRVAVEKWEDAIEDDGSESHDETMSIESTKHYDNDSPSSFSLWRTDVESDSSLNYSSAVILRSIRFREDLSFKFSVMGSKVDIQGSPNSFHTVF